MTRFENTPRALVILTAIALLVCFAFTLRGMADQWLHDEDMGHSFVVPVAIAWVVWRERKRWRSLQAQPSGVGFIILGAGAAMQLASALGAGLFAGSLGFVLSLAGAIVCLGGFAWLRIWAFPLLLNVHAPQAGDRIQPGRPAPTASCHENGRGMLSLAGFSVVREGNILVVSGHRISVVAACNGIRYLLPLAFIGVLFAYLSDSKRWMRAPSACPL